MTPLELEKLAEENVDFSIDNRGRVRLMAGLFARVK